MSENSANMFYPVLTTISREGVTVSLAKPYVAALHPETTFLVVENKHVYIDYFETQELAHEFYKNTVAAEQQLQRASNFQEQTVIPSQNTESSSAQQQQTAENEGR